MKSLAILTCLPCALLPLHIYAIETAYMQLQPMDTQQSFEIKGSAEDLTRLNAFNLIPEEYRTELLSLSKAFETLDSGTTTSCSDRLTILLQRCTKDRLSTEDRNEAAVLFTLCDRGQDYVPPMECEGLMIGPDEIDKHAIRRCYLALDQHQNFQRTFDAYRTLIIPEKCRSLNGIFHVDPSREIYKNITLELISSFQNLSRREARTEEYFSQWDQRLNAFRDATTELSTAKRSLMEFNEDFVSNLMGLLEMINMTFNELSANALTANGKISSELSDRMVEIRKEHAASLVLAVSSVESLVSERLSNLLNDSREVQDGLNSVMIRSISQIMETTSELSTARQDFQALGVFVKEMSAKAYNQAFLLDKKQLEVSESLSELTAEISSLASTTHLLNDSLASINDGVIEDLAPNSRFTGSSWLTTTALLRNVLNWLGIPSFWAFSFLLMSLPRFVTEQALKLVLWVFAVIVSFLVRTLFSHRGSSTEYDAEGSARGHLPVHPPRLSHSQVPCGSFPQIAYLATEKTSSQMSQYTKEVDKPLSDRVTFRTCSRMGGTSRIPERLYSTSSRPSDAFSRVRSPRL